MKNKDFLIPQEKKRQRKGKPNKRGRFLLARGRGEKEGKKKKGDVGFVSERRGPTKRIKGKEKIPLFSRRRERERPNKV